MIRTIVILAAVGSLGATYRTPNFIVQAPTAKTARQVAVAAEHYRKKLALEWLGKQMPRWYAPCRVTVKVGQVGAGGATSFKFDRGHVFGWKMKVQGPLDRILDAVLPHEITHTILACHFRRPLPRWADEGAATLAEDDSEKRRQTKLVEQLLKSSRRIPLRTLLSLKQYPRNMRNVLTLYAEGYSLAEYLIQQGGKARYLAFLKDAHRQGWDRSIHRHYDVKDVDDLEKRWNAWVTAGSPTSKVAEGELLADATSQSSPSKPTRPETAAANALQPELVVRSQSPEEDSVSGNAIHLASAGRTARDRLFDASIRTASRSVGHSSIRRGEGLYAPNPRLQKPIQPNTTQLRPLAVTPRPFVAIRKVRLQSPQTISHHSAATTTGLIQAQNDGWAPISRRFGRSRQTQFSAGNRSGRSSQNTQVGQPSSSGRFLDWSDFPQRPVESASNQPGAESRVSLSSRKPSD